MIGPAARKPGRKRRRFRIVGLVLPLLCGACAVREPPPCAVQSPLAGPAPAEIAWLVDQGWHTEIALPADAIRGPLATFREIFPGVRVLVFGFGKRTFITAKVETLGELLMGPVPGPGAIQVIGLRVPPSRAFAPGAVTRLALQPGQMDRLSAFIWQSIGKTRTGRARLISQGLFAGSLFYAASSGYAPGHTCNTWTAQALREAGLPVNPAGVILAGALLNQTAALPAACLAGPG